MCSEGFSVQHAKQQYLICPRRIMRLAARLNIAFKHLAQEKLHLSPNGTRLFAKKLIRHVYNIKLKFYLRRIVFLLLGGGGCLISILATKRGMAIVSLNVNGLHSHLDEIRLLIWNLGLHILALNETKLDFNFPEN